MSRAKQRWLEHVWSVVAPALPPPRPASSTSAAVSSAAWCRGCRPAVTTRWAWIPRLRTGPDRAAFDNPTAQWCFRHLPQAEGDDGGWLRAHLEQWDADWRPWAEHVHDSAAEQSLHEGDEMLAALRQRFREQSFDRGPYFFADLRIPAAEEQAAIDAGVIRANGLRWIGTPLNREQ